MSCLTIYFYMILNKNKLGTDYMLKKIGDRFSVITCTDFLFVWDRFSIKPGTDFSRDRFYTKKGQILLL